MKITNPITSIRAWLSMRRRRKLSSLLQRLRAVHESAERCEGLGHGKFDPAFATAMRFRAEKCLAPEIERLTRAIARLQPRD